MAHMNKKGNLNVLTSIALGIIMLVVVVGIGLVVLTNLGNSVATCGSSDYPTFNSTLQACMNATGSLTNTTAATGTAFAGINYGITQLGSAGLLSWLPAVIALLIGVFFLSYFGGKQQGAGY